MRIRIIILSLFLSFTISAQVPFGFFGGGVAEAISMFVNHKSITLDGSTQYASFTDSSFRETINVNSAKFTITAWVYKDVAGAYQTIIGKYASATLQREWLLRITNTETINFLADGDGAGGGSYSISSTETIPLQQWTHVAVVVDMGGAVVNDRILLYVNGVESHSGSGQSYTQICPTCNAVAKIGESNSQYMDGNVDGVTLWNKELSVSEIKEAMALRDLEYHSAYANIVSWWEFDDADVSGTTVDDRVGANNATMVNAPTRPQAIPYPYSYQLYASATYDSLTLMQSADASAFGGVAIDLDGSAEYLTTPDNALLSRGDGSTDNPLSFYAVVNADDFTNFQICEKSGEYAFWVNASDQLEVRFTDASSGGYIGRLYSTPITGWEGQTVVLMATKTGTTAAGIDLYFNGLVVDDVDATSGAYTAMEDGAGAFRMGYNGTTYGNGRIGDVGFLDVEATAAQALTLYNEHGDVDLRDTDVSGDLIVYYNGYNSTSATATDLSANGLNSTFTNGDVTDIQYNPTRQIFEADSSGSFVFDGATIYASISDASTLSFTDDSTYMSAFINMTDATSFPIFSKAHEYLFWINASDKLEARFIDSSSAGYIGRIYNTAITANQGDWIFVEATFDGTNVDIRLNGATVDDLDANSGAFTSMEDTYNVLYLGYDGTNYADGSFALSSIGGTSIDMGLQAFNDGSPVDPRLTTFAANIVSAWRFNQGDSPTAADGILDIVGSNPATGVNTPTISTTSFPTN